MRVTGGRSQEINYKHKIIFIMSLLSNIITEQTTGSHPAATAKYKAESRHLAIGLFNEAKYKLLDINNWERLCDGVAAEFRLTDEKGEQINSLPVVGNLIRIKLPLQSNHATEFEWARIEKFESSKDLLKDEEVFGFHVKPVKSPLNNSEIKSLYANEVTCSFIILRKSDSIIAMECEKIINKPESFLNKMRQLIISSLTMIGFSKPQWKKLVSGIVRPSLSYA